MISLHPMNDNNVYTDFTSSWNSFRYAKPLNFVNFQNELITVNNVRCDIPNKLEISTIMKIHDVRNQYRNYNL